MLRIRLSAMIASSAIVLGCQDNPNSPSSILRLPAGAAISASKSSAPGPGGVAAQVALIEHDVLALGNIFGVAPQPGPGNNGIPHRLDAVTAQVQVIQDVINGQISETNAAIGAGTATSAGLDAFVAKLVAAQLIYVTTKTDAIVIDNMFDMQLLMNHLSQVSEISTSALSAANQAIADMAKDIKG